MADVPVITQLECQQFVSYENLEVPQIQLIVEVVDIPVVSQRQVPTVLVPTLQVHFLEVVDTPAVVQRQVPAVAACCQGGRRPCCAGRRRGTSSSWTRSLTRPLVCNDRCLS